MFVFLPLIIFCRNWPFFVFFFFYLFIFFFSTTAEDWSVISDEAKDLIDKMLKFDPKDRISATEAYAHPWIISNVHVEPLDDKMMRKLS